MKSNRRITRRILALVMILCMLTALTACGADDEDRQSRPSRNETTADVTATSTPIPTNTPVPTDTPTPTPVPDYGAEALDKLIEIVDQTMKVSEETRNSLNTNTIEDPYTKIVALSEIIKSGLGKMTQYRSQADDITGLDDNIKEASDSFFEMLINAYTAAQSTLDFFAQVVLACSEEFPNSNSSDLKATLNALTEWYNTTKQKIDAIRDVPSCLRADWEQFKKTVSIYETIIDKIDTAVYLEDWLRYYSGMLLCNRFSTAVNSDMQELLEDVQGEMDFADKQEDYAERLVEEIRKCAGMDKEKRERYSFANRCTNEVLLEYEAVDTIYPTLYNTYNSFAIIKAGCISGTHKITVEAEIPGYTQKYRQSFTLDASYATIRIKPPIVTDSLNLSSAKNAQLVLSVYEQDGFTLIETQTFPIKLKSRNDFEWMSDVYGLSTMDNILCYLTPESSAITLLKRTAIDEISAMTGGQMESFPGYQGSQWNHYVITYLQAAGVMRALNVLGVRYNMDAFSISNSNQHILLPDEVLESRSGLCIETSLVVASALQSANMHTFLIFPPGHAQVAVETWSGSGEYFLIETTALSDKQNSRDIFVAGANNLLNLKTPAGSISYYDESEWKAYLEQEVEYIIDCDDSIVLGRTTATN